MAPPSVLPGGHLDEDALAPFVEGRLTKSESAPLISHLVTCAPCRRATAHLIRLESALGGAETTPSAPPEPGRFRRFFADLTSRALSLSENETVFAYQAPNEDSQQRDEVKGGEESNYQEGERPSDEQSGKPSE